MGGWVGWMVIIGPFGANTTNTNTDHLLLPVRAGKGKSLQCSGSPLTACRITCVYRDVYLLFSRFCRITIACAFSVIFLFFFQTLKYFSCLLILAYDTPNVLEGI